MAAAVNQQYIDISTLTFFKYPAMTELHIPVTIYPIVFLDKAGKADKRHSPLPATMGGIFMLRIHAF
jgi:hypothetical protein